MPSMTLFTRAVDTTHRTNPPGPGPTLTAYPISAAILSTMRRRTHSLRRFIVAAVVLPYLLLQVQTAVACVLLNVQAADPCAIQQMESENPAQAEDCCQLGYQPASEIPATAPLAPPDIATLVALPSPVLLYLIATMDEATPPRASKNFSPPSSTSPPYLATLRLRI